MILFSLKRKGICKKKIKRLRDLDANNTFYTLAATSKVSSAILIKYFSKYPLFTSKFLDYKDWEQVAYLIINNQHLTEEGINTVELVRSRMNTKRTEFNWDHLQNFY